MNKPLVTVVTATTCSKYLKKNIESVKNQTYENVQHLVVVDGMHHMQKLDCELPSERHPSSGRGGDYIILPYATGIDQYNGHKIYAAATFLAKGDYIMYLDEDNWIEPEHIESLVSISSNESWSCSLRKITDMDGNYICNDDCESLGNWESVIGDYFVDVNCYFLPKMIALQLSPLWHRRARHPEDQPEVDRALSLVLRQNDIPCNVSGKYTVNYRAGNRQDSVQPSFFIQGNAVMNQKYNGQFPWRK